jgi:anthranilate synthase component 2
MLLLIDNYDSFTWNLVHYLGELGAEVAVRRNDALDVQAAMGMRPDGIVLSPGPCDPAQAGICLPLIQAAAEARIPLLGVCLGHQAVGEAMGGARGALPRDRPRQDGDDSPQRSGRVPRAALAFPGDPLPFADRGAESLPGVAEVTAWLADGTIMGLRHRTLPIEGVQFHPESIA